MGSIINWIKEQDKAQEQQMEQAAKNAVEISQTMINKKFAEFQDQLNTRIGTVQKIPAKYLIAVEKKICVQVYKNSSGVIDSLKDIVKGFADGRAADSIISILNTTLNLLLGAYGAGYNESQDYLVVTNILGGIYRIDYLVVQQKFESNGIQSRCNNVFGSYLVISSVDKQSIKDDNVYRVLVDRQFPFLNLRQKLLMLKLTKGQELTADELSEIQKIKQLLPVPQKSPENPIASMQQEFVQNKLSEEKKSLEKLKLRKANLQDDILDLGLRIKTSQFRLTNLKQLAAAQQSKPKQPINGQNSDEDGESEAAEKPKLIEV